MSTGLLYGLGLVCAVWAIFEGLRLFAALRRRRRDASRPDRGRPDHLGHRDIHAWDQRRRRVDVEEFR